MASRSPVDSKWYVGEERAVVPLRAIQSEEEEALHLHLAEQIAAAANEALALPSTPQVTFCMSIHIYLSMTPRAMNIVVIDSSGWQWLSSCPQVTCM